MCCVAQGLAKLRRVVGADAYGVGEATEGGNGRPARDGVDCVRSDAMSQLALIDLGRTVSRGTGGLPALVVQLAPGRRESW